jgi:hypothetical protein
VLVIEKPAASKQQQGKLRRIYEDDSPEKGQEAQAAQSSAGDDF